jgi:hypothetical protein
MQLTDADILEFQQMCKRHLGLELPWEIAQDQAVKLVRVMQIVHRPMSLEQFEAVQEQDRSTNENENDYEPERSETL